MLCVKQMSLAALYFSSSRIKLDQIGFFTLYIFSRLLFSINNKTEFKTKQGMFRICFTTWCDSKQNFSDCLVPLKCLAFGFETTFEHVIHNF